MLVTQRIECCWQEYGAYQQAGTDITNSKLVSYFSAFGSTDGSTERDK